MPAGLQARTAWVACALAVSGCAGAGVYDRAMAEASRDESAGRLADAIAGYDRAASVASRARDRDQARWDAADVMARAKDVAGAVARLDAIARDDASEHQAEAAYRAAALRIEHGDADAGWEELERVPRRFPRSGVAHVAVRRLAAHADEAGPAESARELAALTRDLSSTEVGQVVAFLAAEHVEASGSDAGARDAYLKIADRWPYPFGAFFDDALWKASALDEKLGRYEAAVSDLERLVSVRETTSLMGSYERAKYVPAMLRLGELYRDRLHDHARARAAYHRLYTDFDRSTKRAEALWLEAALWREDGEVGKSCDTLAALVHEFPESRYAPCAVARCPALHATDQASKRACPAYVETRDER